MPARLNNRHQQMVRDKIQATQLINRLHACAMGEIELTTSQIKAIEILLKKSVPDLSSVELSGEDGGPLQVIQRIERVVVRANAAPPDS